MANSKQAGLLTQPRYALYRFMNEESPTDGTWALVTDRGKAGNSTPSEFQSWVSG